MIVTDKEKIHIIKEAYSAILEVANNHQHIKDYGRDFEDIGQLVNIAKDHLTIIDWLEKYGLELDHEYKPHSRSHISTNEYMSFSYYANAAEQHSSGRGGRYISWSDDGTQPLNEWLCHISFSTGAYIFGEDYQGQKQLFQEFFEEIKTYKPDFSDTTNHCLYWKMENAKDIFNNFSDILKKYRDRNSAELKQREIQKLQDKLDKLKGGE